MQSQPLTQTSKHIDDQLSCYLQMILNLQLMDIPNSVIKLFIKRVTTKSMINRITNENKL